MTSVKYLNEASMDLETLPAPVSASWQRCVDAGLRRTDAPRSAVIHAADLRCKREESHRVWKLAQAELQGLFAQIAGSNYVVAFADAGGTILEAIHDHEFTRSSASNLVIPGSVWDEDIRGTNALGLTLQTESSCIVDGAEHFLSRFENISCYASPVRNSQNQVVGVIDASTDARSRQKHTLALVELAAANVEQRLFLTEFEGSLILGFHARPEFLQTTSVGMLALNKDGFIIGANRNAQEMLHGFDLHEPILFDTLFDIRFGDFLEKVLTRGMVDIKDRMRSSVFFTVKDVGHLMQYISRIHVAPADIETPARPSKSSAPPSTALPAPVPKIVCKDPQILSRIEQLLPAFEPSGALICSGPQGSGKTEICRQLLNRLAPKTPFVDVDADLLTPEHYEQLMYGSGGRLSYFEPDHYVVPAPGTQDSTESNGTNTSPLPVLGKMQKSAKGMLYIRNAEKLSGPVADDLNRIIKAQLAPSQDNHAFHRLLPRVLVLATSATKSAVAGNAFPDFKALVAEVDEVLKVPHINQRLDIENISRTMVASIDSTKILTTEAQRLIGQHYWKNGLRSLRKTLVQVVRDCEEQFIRADMVERHLVANVGEIQPCPSCKTSVIKRDKCMKIRKTWQESGGNVSLVSRSLGLSRTTIYAHLPERNDEPMLPTAGPVILS